MKRLRHSEFNFNTPQAVKLIRETANMRNENRWPNDTRNENREFLSLGERLEIIVTNGKRIGGKEKLGIILLKRN